VFIPTSTSCGPLPAMARAAPGIVAGAGNSGIGNGHGLKEALGRTLGWRSAGWEG